jgi:hypothetical protein
MRKLFALLFGLLAFASINAQQVSRDMVVVEGGTGFW